MQVLKDIVKLIDSSIKEDANNIITAWGIIKDDFDPEVREYRSLIDNSHNWLNEYTKKLSSDTNITTLKIKFTNNAGYFIEVPSSQKSKIPDNFIHTTTLVNAVRFTTPELKEFESKVLNAKELLAQREYEIFKDISNKILDKFKEIKKFSNFIWHLDFISSLWGVALDNNYTRPEIKDDYWLEIYSWRHPVVEKIEKNFISNDLFLDSKNYINIITWPNMWWKSTYLRQNALIILMAHIWSFVPAKKAVIPLTDKIFCRVW